MARECRDCPHKIGNATERDCCFPDCKGWNIEKNVKPIPNRDHDYDFWHDEYDGQNKLCGTAKNVFDAIEQIREIEAEL